MSISLTLIYLILNLDLLLNCLFLLSLEFIIIIFTYIFNLLLFRNLLLFLKFGKSDQPTEVDIGFIFTQIWCGFIFFFASTFIDFILLLALFIVLSFHLLSLRVLYFIFLFSEILSLVRIDWFVDLSRILDRNWRFLGLQIFQMRLCKVIAELLLLYRGYCVNILEFSLPIPIFIKQVIVRPQFLRDFTNQMQILLGQES